MCYPDRGLRAALIGIAALVLLGAAHRATLATESQLSGTPPLLAGPAYSEIFQCSAMDVHQSASPLQQVTLTLQTDPRTPFPSNATFTCACNGGQCSSNHPCALSSQDSQTCAANGSCFRLKCDDLTVDHSCIVRMSLFGTCSSGACAQGTLSPGLTSCASNTDCYLPLTSPFVCIVGVKSAGDMKAVRGTLMGLDPSGSKVESVTTTYRED